MRQRPPAPTGTNLAASSQEHRCKSIVNLRSNACVADRCRIARVAQRMLRPLTALHLALSVCDAFVLTEGNYRWSVPAAFDAIDGLGGGIGYAIDESFCSKMLARFPERSLLYGLEVPALQFVHCSDIQHSIQRGFHTWSMNHRLLSFNDLSTSASCARTASVTGDPTADACPWELYIGTDDGSTHESLAAYVVNHRRSAVDEDGWWKRPVRSSSGIESSGDALARSVMRFQTHLCWYMDATFCYYFQVLHEVHNVDVLMIVRLTLLLIFLLAALRCALIFFWCLVALLCIRAKPLPLLPEQRKHPPSCCASACTACLNYLSTLSPGGNVLVRTRRASNPRLRLLQALPSCI